MNVQIEHPYKRRLSIAGPLRAVGSILDGLSITTSYLFQAPATVQYPRVECRPEPGFRGRLAFSEEQCTVCTLCEKSCPLDCISVTGVKLEGRKGRAPIRFDLKEGACMYCGLCVESCSTGALRFTEEFEGASFQLSDLNRNMVESDLCEARSLMTNHALQGVVR